jgi:hypothetical protein
MVRSQSTPQRQPWGEIRYYFTLGFTINFSIIKNSTTYIHASNYYVKELLLIIINKKKDSTEM